MNFSMKFNFKKVTRASCYAEVPEYNWEDWKWQMSYALKTEEDYSSVFDLSEDESKGFGIKKFQVQTTPYYASLASNLGVHDPIRKMQVPSIEETFSRFQEQFDPLAEEKNSITPRLVHRYSDRALFLVTDICGIYCRYCTRKRFTGKSQAFVGGEDYAQSISYLRSSTGIREVILSGGDPLTLSDGRIEKVVSDLREIEHIEIIRIGTRMPAINPFRITNELVERLKKFHPIYMMTHFNHPSEVTLESSQALTKLVDNGFPVFNQMVLLNGINNHAAIVQALSRRLLYLRVKPYYMLQCDPSEGSDHLRTSIESSEKIQRELWGHLSGLAMPNLIVDLPDGGGKVGVVPKFETENQISARQYRGWDGVETSYINPSKESQITPIDVEDYVDEWESLKGAKSY